MKDQTEWRKYQVLASECLSFVSVCTREPFSNNTFKWASEVQLLHTKLQIKGDQSVLLPYSTSDRYI